MAESSINFRFFLIVLLVLGLLGTASYLIMEKVYRVQLRNQASTVADNVQSFGQWVANYGRIWVESDTQTSFLGNKNVIDVKALPDLERIPSNWLQSRASTMYSKNPALAQREFSEVAWDSSSPAKFRMTSENYMNPLNKPDTFETLAMTRIKESGVAEVDQFDKASSTYRYARAIRHEEGCIACHGSPESAPADVIARYGSERGFGFEAGDLAGVISVRLPTGSFLSVLIPFVGATELLLIAMAIGIPILFMQVSVLKPIKKLADSATQLSIGVVQELELTKSDQHTKNEINQLGLAIKRLNTSTQMALARMTKTPQSDHARHE